MYISLIINLIQLSATASSSVLKLFTNLKQRTRYSHKMFIKIFLLICCVIFGIAGHILNDDFHNVQKLTGQHLGRAYLETIGKGKYVPEEEKNPEFWRSKARQELEENLKKQQLNMNKAKNIIMFLGDGMSLSTVAAARMHKGQRKGNTGEEEVLSFEKFPYTGLSKVTF